MKTLYFGSTGPQVQLLQLALKRAGYDPGQTDGIFGRRTEAELRQFQSAAGLTADGIAGVQTHGALLPWYTGALRHTLRPGDTFYRLAQRYGTTPEAIEAANPRADPLNLTVGQSLTVPLGFDVVPTDIDWCSELVRFCCEGLAARYPLLRLGRAGYSVLGRPLWLLRLGEGSNRVFYNAAHHANEWITTPLLLCFTEELTKGVTFAGEVGGVSAGALLEGTELAVLPCVNPDGMDLVTGDLSSGQDYDTAAEIARGWPSIPFPSGWKANIRGVDPNLQYPAGWETARRIKFSQGFTSPAPRDYVGEAPLVAPESRAAHAFTLDFSPALTLSYHTQGGVIYWKFQGEAAPGAEEIARSFSEASGYLVEDTPYASGFAGYKDWFIQNYNRPGYTIEAGMGDNPLPISAFPEIYRDNLGILTQGMTATK